MSSVQSRNYQFPVAFTVFWLWSFMAGMHETSMNTSHDLNWLAEMVLWNTLKNSFTFQFQIIIWAKKESIRSHQLDAIKAIENRHKEQLQFSSKSNPHLFAHLMMNEKSLTWKNGFYSLIFLWIIRLDVLKQSGVHDDKHFSPRRSWAQFSNFSF